MKEKIKQIHFLVMDVDGTLTDGKIYMGNDGEVFKAFNIKDGCGIYRILPKLGIIPVIITGRRSDMVKMRMEELAVSEIYQGESDKPGCLNKILEKYSVLDSKKYSLKNTAYIGDDIIDLDCMRAIAQSGGITAAPADAVDEVKEISDYICCKKGGDGAVREFIDFLAKS